MDGAEDKAPPSYSEAVRDLQEYTGQSEQLQPEKKSTSDPDQPATKPNETEPPASDNLAPIPSHSPLAFANYPPLWSPSSKPKHSPQPSPSGSSTRQTTQRTQSGASAASLSAVMSSGSKDPKGKRFDDKVDSNNRHRYAQNPGRTQSGLHYFGIDVGGLSKRPPGLNFKRQKGK